MFFGNNIVFGLMGVGNDAQTLYKPNGKKICRAPKWLAWRIQRIQHIVSQISHGSFKFKRTNYKFPPTE